MELKPRPLYLEKLIAFKDTEFIKVVVGMRRCGKSSLLQLFAQYLVGHSVASSQVIAMNLEAAEYLHITNCEDLLAVLKRKIESVPDGKMAYVLLDEVQIVPNWEKVVNALRLEDNLDIYITGSNAYMLSSQLATLLSGRYVEIRVYPLTFAEFVSFVDSDDSPEALFERYMQFGGLPPVVEQGSNRMLAETVLSGIYDTVFVKDIAQHIQVRNSVVFEDVARYLADTSGSGVSISKMEKRLSAARRKTSGETIERYTQALVDAFIFYRARRFNLRGGEYLQGLGKFYPADPGIKNVLLGFPSRNYGFALEGIIHNELVARGFDVCVGKLDDLEVDFVANRAGGKLYMQVSASLLDEATRKRELASLRCLPEESGRKMVVTLDRLGLGQADGIEVVNAIDWLLAE